MFPNSFSLGPLTIHFYGIIIAIAVLSGWSLAKKRAAIYKIPKSVFDEWKIALPLILGIIGARLYHVLDKWSYYHQNPGQAFMVNNGGLGIWGGILGMFFGFWLISKIRKINALSFLDLISPSILLAQAIGRIGNYINQEGFGPPTSLPWGVYIDPTHRPFQNLQFTHFHPTFFYEAVLNLIAFFILIRFSSKFPKPGQIFGLYLALYGVIRFITEFWRIDTAVAGEIKIAHILSLASLLIGIFLFKVSKGASQHIF